MSDDFKSRFTEADVITALTKVAEVVGVGGAMGLVVRFGGVDMVSRLHPRDYEKVVLACERVASHKPPGATVH